MNKLHKTIGSDKMKGITSINTPVHGNAFCEKMRKTDSICKSCFAYRNESFRKNLVPAFSRNIALLNDPDYVPEKVNEPIIRLHSYGELMGKNHFESFVKLARFNPDTIFTLWTKRTNIVQAWLRANELPANMILIYSNPTVNKERKTAPKGFHKVFNVHTKKEAVANNVEINCGGKKCVDCMCCYTLNNVVVINELRK